VISYYASIKNISPVQWGQMYSYITIDTGYQKVLKDASGSTFETVFGGESRLASRWLKCG
jgi:hypothetical protein